MPLVRTVQPLCVISSTDILRAFGRSSRQSLHRVSSVLIIRIFFQFGFNSNIFILYSILYRNQRLNMQNLQSEYNRRQIKERIIKRHPMYFI